MRLKRTGWLGGIALFIGIAPWNTAAGAGTVRFLQPYDPLEQTLILHYDARVDRGTAELSANSFVVPGTRFEWKITQPGTGEIQVPLAVTGLHDVKLTSDLGAFDGEVRLRWAVR